MKKSLLLTLAGLVVLTVLAFGLPSQTKASGPASEHLKGYILLQVENNGEAWYIDPQDGYRYYLARPTDAFNIMRLLGLGATHADIEKIPSNLHNDSDLLFANMHIGEILLDVERNGEAWYIYPGDMWGYYLDRPGTAFQVMRNTGLGATDSTVMGITPNISISGVRYDGTGSAEPDEFVQLVNNGRMAQDVGQWTIEDGDGHEFEFPGGYTIQPGEFVRIFTNTGDLSFDSGTAIWNNDGDTCFLYGSTGSLVDMYAYSF
ncbi:MAG: lamin tail domain-containing protein [Parcubacteria group bacterium]|nr:lamin tail domain-containing protein [Parcubacteria group bacterium]